MNRTHKLADGLDNLICSYVNDIDRDSVYLMYLESSMIPDEFMGDSTLEWVIFYL